MHLQIRTLDWRGVFYWYVLLLYILHNMSACAESLKVALIDPNNQNIGRKYISHLFLDDGEQRFPNGSVRSPPHVPPLI